MYEHPDAPPYIYGTVHWPQLRQWKLNWLISSSRIAGLCLLFHPPLGRPLLAITCLPHEYVRLDCDQCSAATILLFTFFTTFFWKVVRIVRDSAYWSSRPFRHLLLPPLPSYSSSSFSLFSPSYPASFFSSFASSSFTFSSLLFFLVFFPFNLLSRFLFPFSFILFFFPRSSYFFFLFLLPLFLHPLPLPLPFILSILLLLFLLLLSPSSSPSPPSTNPNLYFYI